MAWSRNRQTQISLPKRLNLNRNTIQLYGILINKGKNPKRSCERRPRIDSTGLEKLNIFCKYKSDDNLQSLSPEEFMHIKVPCIKYRQFKILPTNVDSHQ